MLIIVNATDNKLKIQTSLLS